MLEASLFTTVAGLSITTIAQEALKYQKNSLRENYESEFFLHFKNWAFLRAWESKLLKHSCKLN